jgi:two-component system, response regulator RpfG
MDVRTAADARRRSGRSEPDLGADAAGPAREASRADPASLHPSALERAFRHAAEIVDAHEGVPGHGERVAAYTALLAGNLGLDEEECGLIGLASLLHDIGKLGIPAELLRKPSTLDLRERGVVEMHTEVGHGLLARARHPVLRVAAVIAHTHHERFDGSGYPRGLAGTEIPPSGLIVAVADVLDALTTDRCYRPALPLEEALGIIVDGRGRAFDPAVVDVLLDGWQTLALVRML